MEDNMGSTNQVVGNILQQAYDQKVRIEMYEAAYQRAQVCKDFMRAYFSSTMNRNVLNDQSQKVGIVSHGMFVRCMSASSFDIEKQKLVGA